MSKTNKNYFSLIIWIAALILIGGLIGSLSQSDTDTWYHSLNRSSLTPPNAVFPIVWTILYAMIGACGWIISSHQSGHNSRIIKKLYLLQLLLNWSWSPLFFHYHAIKLSLIVIIALDLIVAALISLAYKKQRVVCVLMMPYFLWLLLATYLNAYIVGHNS